MGDDGWKKSISAASHTQVQSKRHFKSIPQQRVRREYRNKEIINANTTTLLLERIAVDIAGPSLATDNGNKDIVVVIDYVTKWLEMFAIPNQEAVTMEEKYVNAVFCRFGTSDSVIS
ncbi:hypothetical protein EVAR_31612_1 [Eumeta japonica]|uniref:Integrase catalytic domain-containing protein n=1 Tax=Eumeta variegata TaxID=151549 RepID=A0A4C1VYQ6_EUMVA|nr:hypothetical protein EVAR_31612_1 [Eumeta japonica]